MSEEKKLNGTVIVTYRCNARCSMCNRYKAPSKPEEEISIETIKKLPKMYFTNITGGEPFIRTDLKDIVRELYKKSDRIVISTNGFFTDRIVDLCKEFPQIGIRISIEGLEQTNNEIRGLQNGYQRGYGTLKKLREMGMKDVGFGMTVQDKNALWNSSEAEKVRAKVRCCDRDCWMIGSVSPAMHKYIWKPATWVLVHKFKALFTKHPYSMYELKICRDYRDGKVTKEDLDKCSTCDMNCVINNGLSEASKEQLKHKTGEEIVDADIAQQMEK